MSALRRFPYWRLVWVMASSEAKLRDQGTVLGFLWTLLHPLLMFLVLYALFMKWMGRFVDNYAAYLLVGLVFWNFFQRGTAVALSSLRRQAPLLLNYRFPREITVLSSVGAVLWSSLLEMAVLLIVLPFLGVEPRWAWLSLPLVIALEATLVCGAALLLAVLAVEYQDMERIWEVLSAALFYLTPVFYPVSVLRESRQDWVMLSPIAQLIQAARFCLIDGRWPDPAPAAALALSAAVALGAGLFALRRLEPRLADRLIV